MSSYNADLGQFPKLSLTVLVHELVSYLETETEEVVPYLSFFVLSQSLNNLTNMHPGACFSISLRQPKRERNLLPILFVCQEVWKTRYLHSGHVLGELFQYA